MRGNLRQAVQRAFQQGPIPAYAGEPWPSSSPKTRPWAYPRVCGGTVKGVDEVADQQGLSPRMRGNPRRTWQDWEAGGPIPAYAGEPFP